jgi:diguanylate cyclase (GGDEF)-like protein
VDRRVDELTSGGLDAAPAADAPLVRRVDELLDQAWECRHEDTRRALAVNRDAHALARRLDYARGMAYGGLRTGLCLLILGEQADEAQRLVHEAQQLLRSLGDLRGEAEALNLLAHQASRQGDPQAALDLYRHCLTLRQAAGDAVGQAHALNNVGLILSDTGDCAQALEVLFEALALAEGVGDGRACGYALLNIGTALDRAGDWPTAREHLVRSLALLAATRDRAAETSVRLRLGLGLLQAGDPDGARPHLTRAVELARATGNQGDLSEALSALGRSRHADGQPAAARALHDEALAIAGSLGDPHTLAELLYARAVSLLDQGQATAARDDLRAALALAARAQAEEVHKRAHERLAAAHEALGEHALALRHLREHVASVQGTHAREARRRVQDVLTRMRIAPLERDAEHHRDRAQALAGELDSTRRWGQEREALLQQLSIQAAMLEQLAREDGLTGVANRRWLDLHLERECERARRFGHPLSVAMIDIDHFKRLNDDHSHALGDAVLRAVARCLRDGCRRSDLVGRYGGEEFMLVLAETPPDKAAVLCEKLRRQIAALDWAALGAEVDARGERPSAAAATPELTGPPSTAPAAPAAPAPAQVAPPASPWVGLRVTVSIGVAGAITQPLAAHLAREADRQLYRAKAGGRDRVVVGD